MGYKRFHNKIMNIHHSLVTSASDSAASHPATKANPIFVHHGTTGLADSKKSTEEMHREFTSIKLGQAFRAFDHKFSIKCREKVRATHAVETTGLQADTESDSD